ncbi:hypothetical protein [Palaeococcus ferrophilus]|uniref:hypothetical protein n=1 Tax=Palaeococcus ferrophilus TaxID=83868 RepID=UPI00064E1881|nr:hypothetical protein [Palaeococcus ferrophilus]
MRLERALRELEKLEEKNEKKRKKLHDEYFKKAGRILKGIRKEISGLEREKLPKKVDERLARIVENERRAYITTFANLLGRVEGMDDIGRFLPEFSKFHVGHGRYLLEFFEKRVYKINRLLRDLSALYAEYLEALEKLPHTEVPDVESKLSRMGELRRDIGRLEGEIGRLRVEEESLKEELSRARESAGIGALEERVRTLRSELSSKEMGVVSALSSLKKPLKRARLGGDAFNAFMADTRFALKEPEAVRKLIEEGLNSGYFSGKYELKAREALKALDLVPELRERREALLAAEGELNARRKEVEEFEVKLRHLRESIERKERELERLREEMERLEEQLNEAISRIEDILGERIER